MKYSASVKVRTGIYEDPALDNEIKQFDFWDKTIKPVLIQLVSRNRELTNEIERYRSDLFYNTGGKMITSRRIFAIIYSNVAAQDSVIKTDYVLKLTSLAWKGDKDAQVRSFYNEATE